MNIPQTRRWTGPYLGNYYGDLYKTFNVDLDREEGKVCLSRRLTKVADTSDTNTDTLLRTVAFLRTDADCTDRYWALSDSNGLFRTDGVDPSTGWKCDSLANSPAKPRDFALFEKDTRADSLSRQQLFVTTDSDIFVLNDTGTPVWANNWWTSAAGGTHAGDSALDSTVPHPIEYFPFRRIMLVGNGNKIHTIYRLSPTVNETTVVARLVLPSNLQVRHIFCTTSRAWILCTNTNNAGNGKVVEWDGFSQTYNNIFDVYSPYPLSGIGYSEVPIVINNKGQILEFSGSSFKPMVRNGEVVAFPMFMESENYFGTDSIYPRGMAIGADGLIYITVNHYNGAYKQGGGVWCLNPTTGRLYLKYATSSAVNTTYGEQITQLGGIYSITDRVYPTVGFLIGGGFVNNNLNFDRSAIWSLSALSSTTANRGYFITQYILSSEAKEFWDTLWIHFRRFKTTANRIVVKARGVRPLVNASYAPLDANITWVNATSFTTTLNANDDALAVGDEVEVLEGDNAGTLSHITTIVGNHGAAQTITVDETLTASTNVARARFDRWKKVGVISSSTKYEDNVNIGIDSSYVQFKVEMRGPAAEMQISHLFVNSHPQTLNKK